MIYAWREGNVKEELLAYQGMAQQYFYQGNLKKGSFLFDRAMSGEIEKSKTK